MSETVQTSEETAKKQAVTGFKVVSYSSKRSKTGQKFKVVLEADVEEVGLGAFDMGDFQKALLHHQDGETAVGLNVFMK